MDLLRQLFSGRRSIEKNKAEKLQLAKTLDEFIQQIYWSETLTPNEAVECLSKGLVELVYNDEQHAANGLLVTTDGYFLTAAHCLSQDVRNLSLKDYLGNIYQIKKRIASGNHEDIILGRVDIPKKCQAMQYKFYNTNLISKIDQYKIGEPVSFLSRWNGREISKYGFLKGDGKPAYVKDNGKTYVFKDQFNISLSSLKGDSGGLIVSSNGSLMGFASCKGEIELLCIKIIKALELVHFYKRTLEKDTD